MEKALLLNKKSVIIFLFSLTALSFNSCVEEIVDEEINNLIEGIFVAPDASEIEFVPDNKIPVSKIVLRKKGTGSIFNQGNGSAYNLSGYWSDRNEGDVLTTAGNLDSNNSCIVSFPEDDWSSIAMGVLAPNSLHKIVFEVV